MTIKTYETISSIGLEILVKQKNDKYDAMETILSVWDRVVDGNNHCKTWFEIVNGYKCNKCGAPIFKVVGPFIPYTLDANSAFGCVSCSTVSSTKTLKNRIVSGDIIHDQR